MLKQALAAVLAILVCGAVPAGAEPPAEEARVALERFVAIDVSAQLEGAMAALSDDAFVFDEGLDGQPVRLSGKPAIQKYLQSRSQALALAKSRLNDLLVRADADSAWISATWDHEIGSGDEASTWKQLATFYLRKEAAGWKIAGWHASAAEVPEEPYEGNPEELAPPEASPPSVKPTPK